MTPPPTPEQQEARDEYQRAIGRLQDAAAMLVEAADGLRFRPDLVPARMAKNAVLTALDALDTAEVRARLADTRAEQGGA